MPAPLKVNLSEEEDQQLLNLQQHPETPSKVRYRAEIVRLNAYGWSVSQIAEYKKLSSHTVRKSLHSWSNQGLEGLWEAGGRGRKKSWNEEDIQYLETCIEQEPKTYNSRQLAEKLNQDKGVKLSPDRILKLLKKRCPHSRINDPAEACTLKGINPRMGVFSAWERAPRQRGGDGKELDISHHQVLTRNIKKLNKPI